MTPLRRTDSGRLSSFSGSHVLVTGGGSGIGAALARSAAAAGAGAVSLLDVDAAGAGDVAESLRTWNPGMFAAAFACDVTSSEQVNAAVRAATAAHGPVTFLFANAGIGPCGLFLEGCGGSKAGNEGAAATAAVETPPPPKRANGKRAAAPPPPSSSSSSSSAPLPSTPCPWKRTMDVNYNGVVNTLQAVLPSMVEARKGAVVVTGSMGGFMGAAGLSAYSASKHALRGLCDCLRLELMSTGVSIHLAAPGFVDTPMLRTSQAAASPASKRLSAALSPPLADAETTAAAITSGVLRGKYLIPTDARSRSLVAAASSAGTSPGVLPWPVALLLSPLLVLLATLVRFGMEFGTRRALAAVGDSAAAAVVENGGEEEEEKKNKWGKKTKEQPPPSSPVPSSADVVVGGAATAAAAGRNGTGKKKA